MQLTELTTFLAIIDTGSLVRASEQLNVTQSTVTARLKSLEASLGQPLIHRQKSGATLTAAGVRLQRHATTIVELWGQARREIALPDGLSAMCNLGCHPDLWPLAGERFFAQLHDTLAECAVAVSLADDDELLGWLNRGRIDVALTYKSAIQPSQWLRPAFTDRLILVATQAKNPTRFDPNYVFVEGGEEFARQHDEAYSNAGTARFRFNSPSLGLAHLLTHGGSAYLPERLVNQYVLEGRLYVIDAPSFERHAYWLGRHQALQAWPWFDDVHDHWRKAMEIRA